MSPKEQKRIANTASEYLDNLTDFFICLEGVSQEELKEELRSEGIDPDELISKVNQLVKSKLKEAKGAWREKGRVKRETLLKQMEQAKYKIPESLSELKENIKEMLSGTYGGKFQNYAQAYFRNLEEITEEDLRTFYEDLMKLKFLEDQSKEDNKG
jgi:sugar-specific transcriptional regulator TrmB